MKLTLFDDVPSRGVGCPTPIAARSAAALRRTARCAAIALANASGTTKSGDPYVRVFLPAGELQPGQRIVETLRFQPAGGQGQRLNYTLQLLSGQGQP